MRVGHDVTSLLPLAPDERRVAGGLSAGTRTVNIRKRRLQSKLETKGAWRFRRAGPNRAGGTSSASRCFLLTLSRKVLLRDSAPRKAKPDHPPSDRSGFVYTGSYLVSPNQTSYSIVMTALLTILGRHGYALTFAVLLAETIGLPFPASIALVAAGAGIASHTLSATGVVLAALLGLMAGDIWQFWLGRYTGWALLGFLCRLSMNPETC